MRGAAQHDIGRDFTYAAMARWPWAAGRSRGGLKLIDSHGARAAHDGARRVRRGSGGGDDRLRTGRGVPLLSPPALLFLSSTTKFMAHCYWRLNHILTYMSYIYLI